MPDISGVYRVFGKYAPSDAAYQAEALITRTGDVYRIEWFSGGKRWDGMGVMQNDILAVGIFSQNGNAVICFHIEESNGGLTLSGKWAYQSDNILSVETLIRTGAVPTDLLENGETGFTERKPT